MRRVLNEWDTWCMERAMRRSALTAITCHVNPDCDAVGAMVAAAGYARTMGSEAVCIAPNAYPEILRRITGDEEIVVATEEPERVRDVMRRAEAMIFVDFNTLERTSPLIRECVEKSYVDKVMIDHHPCPDMDVYVAACEPSMSSACEVLMHVIRDTDELINIFPRDRDALLAGMLADTRGFAYTNSRRELLECVDLLVQLGADMDRIYRDVLMTGSEARLRMMGYMLYVNMKVMPQEQAAILTLTNEEYRRFNVRQGETDGLVNLPLQVDGTRLSVLLRQDTHEPGRIRVSLRSAGQYDCSRMASEVFHGGGHKNASGGWLMATMEEALETTRKAIKDYA